MEKKWFIGIDISKKTLDVVIYVPTKKHADETNYERFLNKEEGYKSLLCWLKKKNMAKKRLVISMENTGIYSFDLCLFLEAASIDYCSFNPLHLKRSLGLVRGKNDRVDAERIAYFAYLHRDELSYSKLSGSSIIRLRDFAAERKRFVKQQAEYKGFLTDRKDCEMTSTIERAAHMVKILDEVTCMVTSLPSTTPPGPTAMICACCGFSFSEPGITIPAFVVVSAATCFNTTLSPKGTNFIYVSSFKISFSFIY